MTLAHDLEPPDSRGRWRLTARARRWDDGEVLHSSFREVVGLPPLERLEIDLPHGKYNSPLGASTVRLTGVSKAIVLATALLPATSPRADTIDFESGFEDLEAVGAVVTPTNNVTFTVGPGTPTGDGFIAAVGAPRTGFTPDDAPPIGVGGSFSLSDAIEPPDPPHTAFDYFVIFDSPVARLELDVYDYLEPSGGVATLSVFSDAARSILVGTDSFTAPGGNATETSVDALSVACPSSPILAASVTFSLDDGGTAIDNLRFATMETIDFESGFEDLEAVGSVVTPTNTVTFTVGPGTPTGDGFIAQAGAPRTGFGPDDTPPGGMSSFSLSDAIEPPGPPFSEFDYFIEFDLPVTSLSLDVYDYLENAGGIATLSAFADEARSVLVGTDSFVAPGGDPADASADTLSVLCPSSPIVAASVIFSVGDSGTAIDNVRFVTVNAQAVPTIGTGGLLTLVALLSTGVVLVQRVTTRRTISG